MSQPSGSGNAPHWSELRKLRREATVADDARVRRLVAVVDSAAERGEADQLIAPLRRRLAVLRPPRPLRMMRLLFCPLDPLVQPPAVWRPGGAGIPRTVVAPLSDMVVQALGPRADEVAAMIAGRTTNDRLAIADAGAILWPLAAAALRGGAAPANWNAATGLPASEFGPLAGTIGVLLGEGPLLWSLAMHLPGTDEPEFARGLLNTAAAAGPLAYSMMLVLLLASMPQAGFLVALADEIAAAHATLRLAPDRVFDFLIGAVEARQDGVQSMRTDIGGVLRGVSLLETLLRENANRPSRMTRLERVRRQMDEQCRAAFATTGELLLANEHTAAPAAAPDERQMSREAQARELRRVEAVGRRLGAAQFYDSGLRQVAEQLVAQPDMSAIERLRMAEILLGPDAALSLFGADGAGLSELDALLQKASQTTRK